MGGPGGASPGVVRAGESPRGSARARGVLPALGVADRAGARRCRGWSSGLRCRRVAVVTEVPHPLDHPVRSWPPRRWWPPWSRVGGTTRLWGGHGYDGGPASRGRSGEPRATSAGRGGAVWPGVADRGWCPPLSWLVVELPMAAVAVATKVPHSLDHPVRSWPRRPRWPPWSRVGGTTRLCGGHGDGGGGPRNPASPATPPGPTATVPRRSLLGLTLTVRALP